MSSDLAPSLCAYIAARYPERTGVQVRDLVNINAGWESDVYSFDLEYGPPERRTREPLILRIYPGEHAALKARHEHHALSLLGKQGYPAPRVEALEVDASPLAGGKPFILMERVPGMLMGRLTRNASREEGARYLAQAIDLLVRLHRLDWRPFAHDPAAYTAPDGRAHLRQTLADWGRMAEPFHVPSARAQLAWFGDHLGDVPPGRPAVIHLDFHTNNILVSEDGTATVIDWTCLMVSDPRVDLAWALVLASGGGPALGEAIVCGYERAAGGPVEGLAFFYALACWRRVWSVAIALLHGAGAVGMRPGAEDAIRQSLPAVATFYRALVEATAIPAPEIEGLLGG
jgi:aminoglycoside phosphotransferase (APT) family kinase protein